MSTIFSGGQGAGVAPSARSCHRPPLRPPRPDDPGGSRVLQPGTAKPTHAVPDRQTAEAVTGAADDLRLDRNAGRPQRIGKQLALAERHQGGPIAVHDEEGRIIGAHTGEGMGAAHLCAGVPERGRRREGTRADPVRRGPSHRGNGSPGGSRWDRTGRKGPAPGWRRRRVTSIEFRHVVRGAEQGGQVPAGRGSPDAESAGGKTVLARLGTQPAHGGFDALQSGGQGGVLTEPVVHGGDGQTVGQQESSRAGCLRAAVPIPAGAGAPCKWLLTGWCDLLVCGACLAKVFA